MSLSSTKMGEKIGSITDETALYYYNNNWQVLCDYNDSGVLQHWFAYGNYIDETLITGKFYLWTYFRYYVHGHLYSPVALTNYTGTVQERYEYDAYGNCHILNASYEPRATIIIPTCLPAAESIYWITAL